MARNHQRLLCRLATRKQEQEIGNHQGKDQYVAQEKEKFLQNLENQVKNEVGLGHPTE